MMKLWYGDGVLAASADPFSWRVAECYGRHEGTEAELKISDKTQEASVLLTEDLGQVLGLRKWAESLCADGTPVEERQKVGQVGKLVGRNLAKMHKKETRDAVYADPEKEAVLSLPLTEEVNWYLMMEPLPELFPKHFEKGDQYYKALLDDIKNPTMTYPPCLVHGDFNFGNVVMRTAPEPDQHAGPFVLDWEFASGNGRGVNGDVSEFLSLLHCNIIMARRSGEVMRAELLRQLSQGFCSGYREEAQLNCSMKADDLNTNLYRSVLLLTGRDMVIYASYACDDEADAAEIAKVAGWYLEHAGKDINEFVESKNISELSDEDEGLFHSIFIFN